MPRQQDSAYAPTPVAFRTVDGRVLATHVVAFHQPLELIADEFEAVVRAETYRRPVGIGGCQERANTVGINGHAIVWRKDRLAHVGSVVDDHQAVLSAAR